MGRIAGCVLLVICGIYVGNSVAQSCEYELKLHRTLIKMYSEICILMEYSYLTFGEVISKLSEYDELKDLDFLNVETDDTYIRTALLGKLKDWKKLNDSDSTENLLAFFKNLGTTDIQGQMSYCKIALERENEITSELKIKCKEKAKLFRTLGVLGGVFAAIIMI